MPNAALRTSVPITVANSTEVSRSAATLATGARVIDLLFDLNREHRTTLVLVTHDESLAARCERHIHLDAGRIVKDR